MVKLSCQSEIYVNIMLENIKMAQDGCVKRTRGAMIPPKGKRKVGRGYGETKSYASKCQT